MNKNEKEIVKIKEDKKKQEQKTEQNEERIKQLEKDNYILQTNLMRVERDRAQLMIRVQNFLKSQEEKFQDWLILEIEIDQEIICGGIEAVYRQSSRYARKQNLPKVSNLHRELKKWSCKCWKRSQGQLNITR